ncbi:hypothetical protein NS226_05365 [Aureimonas ureilytica]|uniref:Uncharacterized protein n=1 Tax=Aureimonas ureilytica TaxID=401562 RepID=A0A175RDH5_9HYPH|nr:hypothetical protein NS226_05365 [Aureimonas ureilytica]
MPRKLRAHLPCEPDRSSRLDDARTIGASPFRPERQGLTGLRPLPAPRDDLSISTMVKANDAAPAAAIRHRLPHRFEHIEAFARPVMDKIPEPGAALSRHGRGSSGERGNEVRGFGRRHPGW